jgi:hypothetical protein
MKLTAEQKAKRLKVKETIAALDGERCDWVLGVDDTPSLVFCGKPAWQTGRGRHFADLRCPYHASLKTAKAREAERARFASVEGKSRAEIIAIRDGVAA